GVEDQALGAGDVADEGELLGARARVAGADIAVDDIDLLAAEAHAQGVAADRLLDDLADGAHEVGAVVAHVDADDAPVEAEEPGAEDEAGAGAAGAGGVDEGGAAGGELARELLDAAHVAPGAERARAALGD